MNLREFRVKFFILFLRKKKSKCENPLSREDVESTYYDHFTTVEGKIITKSCFPSRRSGLVVDTDAAFTHDSLGMDKPHSDVPFEARLTRPYLASLSTEELVRLADQLGVDIPYGLDRVFIIEELLELAADDEFGLEIEENEDGVVHQVFKEMTALPRQYNISYIEVMIRDPLWAFVFWEIKSHLKEIYEKSADFEGYFLRVIPLNENGMPLGKDDLFTVSVGLDDNAWYLGFPPAEVLPAPARDALSAFERTRRGPAAEGQVTGKIGRYRVELCAQQDEKLILLTVSRPFKMPRLIESKLNELPRVDLPDEPDALDADIQAVYRNPVAVLSGVNDVTLIRSVNRQSRVRGV